MYQVTTYDDAQEQVAALPAKVLPNYAEATAMLELTPWNGQPYNWAKPDGPMRELIFGDGLGTITYLILEDQREVHIVLVQWIG
jgi:hypothetical protein